MKQAAVSRERDMKRVLAEIAKRSYSSRERAKFMPSYLVGMRVGEIAALKVSDVSDRDGVVRDYIRLDKHQTKGSETSTALLKPQAQEDLRIYRTT